MNRQLPGNMEIELRISKLVFGNRWLDKSPDGLLKAFGASLAHLYGNDIFFELNRGSAVVYELEDDGNVMIDVVRRGTVGLLVVHIVNLS